MAKQSAGFVDRHIEKVALGLGVVLFAGTVTYCFILGRFAVNGLGPAELCAEAEQQATRTASAVMSAKLPAQKSKKAKDEDDPAGVLKEWFGPTASGLTKIAAVQPRLPRAQRFPSLFASTLSMAPEDKRHLARIEPPGTPIIRTGRTTFGMPVKKPNLKEYLASGPDTRNIREAELSWVSVGAQVDLIVQEANFREQKYPDHGTHPCIVKVEIQRLDQTERWRGWQDVQSYVPFESMDMPVRADGTIDLPKVVDWARRLRDCRSDIARPEMPKRLSGDRTERPPIPYLDKPPAKVSSAPVSKWLSLVKKALAGKKPFDAVDLDAATMLARAAVGTTRASASEVAKAQRVLKDVEAKLKAGGRSVSLKPPRAPERMLPIVAHDLDPVPGHTYVYRMRYAIRNIYAGNPGELINPADAERLLLTSDWSPPSRPVQVGSDIFFYLTGADEKRREVTVTVFRKGRRDWRKQDYRIEVGEAIGRKEQRGQNKGVDFLTGAVCIDIDFERQIKGRKTVALVYVDTHTGHVRERTLSRDTRDKHYRQLSQKRVARGK